MCAQYITMKQFSVYSSPDATNVDAAARISSRTWLTIDRKTTQQLFTCALALLYRQAPCEQTNDTKKILVFRYVCEINAKNSILHRRRVHAEKDPQNIRNKDTVKNLCICKYARRTYLNTFFNLAQPRETGSFFGSHKNTPDFKECFLLIFLRGIYRSTNFCYKFIWLQQHEN